jgi:hypothetical protein
MRHSAMNHQLKWRFTSGLVLASMIGQFAVALAAPQPGALDRSSVRSEIASQIDRRFEKETPGLHKSVADKLLDFGASGVKENLVEMLTDFKMGVVQGARTAYNGNGTVVVIGAKNGWRLFKEYGEAAGIHYLDSVKLLPQKAVKIGKRFGKAGQDAGRFAAENAKNTGRAWKQTGKNGGRKLRRI